MTNKFVTARNTVSGVVGSVPAGYLTHPVFGKQLVVVEDDAKDFVPELYTPKTVDEFEEAHATRASRSSKKSVEVEDNTDQEIDA